MKVIKVSSQNTMYGSVRLLDASSFLAQYVNNKHKLKIGLHSHQGLIKCQTSYSRFFKLEHFFNDTLKLNRIGMYTIFDISNKMYLVKIIYYIMLNVFNQVKLCTENMFQMTSVNLALDHASFWVN